MKRLMGLLGRPAGGGGAANQSPTAHAGADQSVTDANSDGVHPVTLDGSGSTDADGSIVAWSWAEGGDVIATGESPTVSLAVGAHTITLTVTDDDGAQDADDVAVTVEAWVPADAPGLVLDLDPSVGLSQDTAGATPATADADPVGRIADQSGAGHHCTQATAANKPTLKLNQHNGKPCLRFDGADFMDNASFGLSANAASVYAVAVKTTAANSFRRIISNENNFYLGHENTAVAQFDSMYGNGSAWVATTGHGTDAELYNTQPYVLASVNNGTDNAYLNSLLVGSRAAAMAAFSDGYCLGRQPGTAAQQWVGDVYRVLVYNQAHDATQRQEVLDYLHATHGIAHLPTFARHAGNPVVPAGAGGTWEDGDVANPDVFRDEPNDRWVMNYSGYDGATWHTGLAYSDDLLTWTKEPANPVFSPDGTEGIIAANGSIVLLDGTYHLYYQIGTSLEIRCATSPDLLTWTRQGSVLGVGAGGQWDDASVFDPMARLNEATGEVELYYAASDGSARACGWATSSDGLTFTRRGMLFARSAFPVAQVDGNFGEPFAWGFRDGGQEFAVTFDGATSGGDRYLNLAWTIDGGTTWRFRRAILDQGADAWEDTQVFDSSPVVHDGVLYLFYAGATNTGGGSGMGAQIGVATAPWPYEGVTV